VRIGEPTKTNLSPWTSKWSVEYKFNRVGSVFLEDEIVWLILLFLRVKIRMLTLDETCDWFSWYTFPYSIQLTISYSWFNVHPILSGQWCFLLLINGNLTSLGHSFKCSKMISLDHPWHLQAFCYSSSVGTRLFRITLIIAVSSVMFEYLSL